MDIVALLEHVKVTFVVVNIVLLLMTLWMARMMRQERVEEADPVVGLVIAHPDDEAMFFAPMLRHLQRKGRPAHVLCLSSGDYDHLGEIRVGEFAKSMALFGVTQYRVVEDARLKDGPDEEWDAAVIAGHVAAFVAEHGLTTLISFDARGVSGHPNHIDVYRGVSQYVSGVEGVVGLSLETVPLWRKYGGILEALGTVALYSDAYVVSVGVTDVASAHKAMKCHSSQYVWFRRLSVVFSRYSFVNSLVRMGTTEAAAGPKRKRA